MGDFADSVGINRSTLPYCKWKTLPNFTNAYIIAQNLKFQLKNISLKRRKPMHKPTFKTLNQIMEDTIIQEVDCLRSQNLLWNIK